VSITAPPPPPPPPPPSGPITITVTPSTATLAPGATQQFTATVTGTTNQSVNWSSTGGGITQTGLYTAPNPTTPTTYSIFAIAAADPTVLKSIAVSVIPTTPPPGGSGVFSGTGPIADWQAYQYLSSDGRYHQAIVISNAKGNYPVRGESSLMPDCSVFSDSFNDFWTPIGNGLWWFTNRPNLIYVIWTWYDNPTDQHVLQQTPCINYGAAPKYN